RLRQPSRQPTARKQELERHAASSLLPSTECDSEPYRDTRIVTRRNAASSAWTERRARRGAEAARGARGGRRAAARRRVGGERALAALRPRRARRRLLDR